MSSYSINGNAIYEGFGLDNNGGVFQWFYTERGDRQTLKYFVNEKEAVQYALEKIKADQFANKNYIGTYRTEHEVKVIIAKLEKRGVEYWIDRIRVNEPSNTQTRIFAIGCGIKLVTDLIQKY